MKFLCDRCKTRYSIADERVRGKILKIRCKNCSAIITVRDGMDNGAAWTAPSGGTGSKVAIRPTNEASASSPAARETEVTSRPTGDADPPAALQEEWYVSCDGRREGPFALSEAQAWVTAKPADAELFCWSEGFDDWLPVEKVSHFRGTRTAPVRRTPPPMPAATTDDDSPPPFGATLAALEADAAESATIAAASEATRAAAPVAAVAARPAPKFDVGEDSADGSAFGNNALTREPEPDESGAQSEAPSDEVPDDDSLSIGEVSRVVRLTDIVKHVESRNRTGYAPAQARNPTGSVTVPRRSTIVPMPLNAGAEQPSDPFAETTGTDGAGSQTFAVAPAPRRRRSIVLPLSLVLVGVLSAVGVVLFTIRDNGDNNAGGGATSNYENLGFQVDDPISRRQPTPPPVVAPGKGTTSPVRPRIPNSNGGATNPTGGPGNEGGPGKPEIVLGPDGKPLRELSPDEVFAMSARMDMGTRRCYDRALKDDPFLKVSKIKATITVASSGAVTSVVLSSMGGTPLGVCLIKAISRWPFRASSGGIVSEFSLVFEQR